VKVDALGKTVILTGDVEQLSADVFAGDAHR